MGMGIAQVVLVIVGVLAAILLGAFALVYLVVPLFKGIGWLVRHLFRFVWGEVSDTLRFVGAVVLSVLYIPLVLGNFIIARFSAAAHFGRALMAELGTAGVCVYRVAIGNPARLLLLNGLTEGLERRLPAVMAAAPTADLPRGAASGKRGQFDGYAIVGSLPGGGSGAKLYVADPDPVKSAAFARQGMSVGQVVIKSFSLADGSSLPQIVRESRSLDAAKRLGLILDHELTPERFYYVMRYVPGESLSLITKQLHASSPADGLANAQLAAALSYATDLVATLSTYHRGGLWHKDVKPDNIIVATKTDRRAHLVDFGLVSSLRSAMTLTTHGTEYFRDPEMVRLALKGVKVHEVDGTKFDIYAAGAVLYSMIEDSFPAHGVLSRVSRRCPEAVKWVIRRAMTEYDKRYASADAMLADLQYIAGSADPFMVMPVDLPSMRGQSGASVPPPLPDAVYANAMAGGGAYGARQAAATPDVAGTPRIRLTNWWSGAARVEGREAVAAGAAGAPAWTVLAQNAVRGAQESVKAAAAGLGINVANVDERPTSEAATPPPLPRMAPGTPRPTAREQLQRAKERIQARRDRANSRLSGVRMPTRHFSPGMGGGVAVALFVFLGACLGVGALLFTTVQSKNTPTVFVASGGDPGAMIEGAMEGLLDGAVAPPSAEEITSVVDEALAQVPLRGRTSAHSVHPAPAAPEAPVPPSTTVRDPLTGTVLLLSDLKPPLTDENAKKLRGLTSRLGKLGLKVIGDADRDGYVADESDIEAMAGARLALGAAPLDSQDAAERVRAWLAKNERPVDAIVWLCPNATDAAGSPTVAIFGKGEGTLAEPKRFERVRASVAKAMNPAN